MWKQARAVRPMHLNLPIPSRDAAYCTLTGAGSSGFLDPRMVEKRTEKKTKKGDENHVN